MKKTTAGALLLVLLGVAGVVAFYFARPYLFDRNQVRTSDARGTTTLNIGGDNYLGYWFVTSPEMRKQAAKSGIAVNFTDDGGAYGDRLARFAAGEYDAIVLPVNSYLEHGRGVEFPGVIAASISESRGADGIVGYGDSLPSGKIEDLNDAELAVVYTPGSPSEFLLDLTISDFDLDELAAADRWRREADGSKDVYQKARRNEGDVFVLWEPDLSRALSLPGMRYIWGSDRFSGYIVDVFVFRRSFLEDNRAAALSFLRTYFRVLTSYSNNRDKMIKEMRQSTDLDAEVIEKMLEKIEWHDLDENRRLQFGIAAAAGERVNEGVVNAIISCTDVMLRTQRLERDPLEGNPYLITNSGLIEELVETTPATTGVVESHRAVTFDELADADWQRLSVVGTFRIEPITFQSWSNQLTPEGQEILDRIALLLINNYPAYRILVRGHTAPGGEEAENVGLSQTRAETVMQYLKAVHGIDGKRLRAEGLGSSQPPQRKPGESPRAYRYRLSRVEFVAVEANPL